MMVQTRVRVGSAYLEKLEVKVGVHQGSVLSPLLFAIVVHVITKKARDVIVEVLHKDGVVLTSETIKDLKEKFCYRKEALESKGLKVNIRKTKVMATGRKENCSKA